MFAMLGDMDRSFSVQNVMLLNEELLAATHEAKIEIFSEWLVMGLLRLDLREKIVGDSVVETYLSGYYVVGGSIIIFCFLLKFHSYAP